MGYDSERDRLARRQEDDRLARIREENRVAQIREENRVAQSLEENRTKDSVAAAKLKAKRTGTLEDLYASEGLDRFGVPLSPGPSKPRAARKLTILKEKAGTYPVETNMDLGEPAFIGGLELEHPEIEDLRAFWFPNPDGFPDRPYLGVRWPSQAPGQQFGYAYEELAHYWRRFTGGGLAFPLEVRTDGYGRRIGIRWLPPSAAARVTPQEAQQMANSRSPWGDSEDQTEAVPTVGVEPPSDRHVSKQLTRVASLGAIAAATWGWEKFRKRGQS